MDRRGLPKLLFPDPRERINQRALVKLYSVADAQAAPYSGASAAESNRLPFSSVNATDTCRRSQYHDRKKMQG